MRKVKTFKWEREPLGATDLGRLGKFVKVPEFAEGNSLFLGWGVDFQDLDHGVGSYTVAIVEHVNGTVELYPVDLIQFMEGVGIYEVGSK